MPSSWCVRFLPPLRFGEETCGCVFSLGEREEDLSPVCGFIGAPVAVGEQGKQQ